MNASGASGGVTSTAPQTGLGLLGPTELVMNGVGVPLGGVKQRAVLAVLALRPNAVVPLDELVDRVWGDRAPVSAVNTVQTYVSRLRRVFEDTGEFVVRSRAGGYSLEGDADRIDVHLFTRMAREAKLADPRAASRLLRGALGLWRGAAFSDFGGWSFADPQAVRLEELRLVVTEQLVAADLELGHHLEMVAELEVLVGVHPLREALWSALMLALYRSGRQADALRAYQRVRVALTEQLGILPGVALQRLEGAILIQDQALDLPVKTLAATARRAVVEAGGLGSGEILVGRNDELDRIDEWLRTAAGGEGQMVLVAGEAGIGKSALAREVMARARRSGMAVACGRVWEEEGAPPFWPWVEILRVMRDEDVAGHGAPGDLEAFVGGPSHSGRQHSSQHSAVVERLRLFESVVAEIVDATRRCPLLIVVEDLHAADIASMNLLLFVARRVASARVLLLATYRPSDVAAAPRGRALMELMREPIARRVELRRLSDSDVAQLLRIRLERDVPADLLVAIQRKAEGHPFFLSELVHLLIARNADLDVIGGDHFEVPHGVQQLVSSRVAMVSDRAARTLRTAAVFGRDVPLRVVQQIQRGRDCKGGVFDQAA